MYVCSRKEPSTIEGGRERERGETGEGRGERGERRRERRGERGEGVFF
jgi:hypothetical protein